MNEKEIAAMERQIVQEAADGKWTQGQLAAVRQFCGRLYRSLNAKLAKEAAR